MPKVPEIRIQGCNDRSVDGSRDYVLYWMIAFRRIHFNFALDHAIALARELKKPLLIFEALRCDYPWASDRLHHFVVEGMAEKLRVLTDRHSTVSYFPYVEPSLGAGKGLLEALAARACAVVTDDYPCFFLPQMIKAASRRLPVRLESVDSNGLMPLSVANQAFVTAHSFRRFLQKNLPDHLRHFPASDPLREALLPRMPKLPKLDRWRPTSTAELKDAAFLAGLPINHRVKPAEMRGGESLASNALRTFLSNRLEHYGEARNEPEAECTSRLSPYLHFGHISAHQIFREIMKREKWDESKIALRATGSRNDWWGVSAAAEEFLDQLATWRELGFHTCRYEAAYDQYEAVPEWARKTLAKHARDERTHLYKLKDFVAARTYDPLWNAAQRQLLREGYIHNYLRMLWGKKILEWTEAPEEALEIIIELNNRYGLDGRDPNSYSGIFWCLGKYDRPWGPERPIFGTVRYMSSENTARKVRVKDYLRRYGETHHDRRGKS